MEAAAAAPLPAPGGGPGPLLLCLALASGLSFFSCVRADANVTTSHGTEGLACGTNRSCQENVTQLRRQGHFSRCPEEYKHYCVKGRCRFLVAEEAPACVHCRKQRRKRKAEEMETLNKNSPSKSDEVLETGIA